MDSRVAEQAAEIGARAERELEALVGVSSPSGDIAGAEEALAVCGALLPPEAQIERIPCSTAGFAPDLIARIPGTGERKLMLLGHVDTVIGHEAHATLRREGEKLYGPGTADMKGGVVLSLGVARALAGSPDRFAELAMLLVCDEEWRTASFAHVERFAGYDACLCFEAGERGPADEEGVVVKRKAAGTLRVDATGRAAHSGSAPDRGANALLALARTATELAALHDPAGPERLSVVPTVIRSGEALNVVPAAGELILDLRADRLEAFESALAAVPERVDGATLSATHGAAVAGDGLPFGDRAAARASRRPARPARGGRPARRGQRREPLRAVDPADGRRARAARRRRPHSRGVRVRAVAGGAGGGRDGDGRGGAGIAAHLRADSHFACGCHHVPCLWREHRACRTARSDAPGADTAEGLMLLGGIVALMWLVEVVDWIDGYGLDTDGIVPANFSHLWAIFTSPFIHANFHRT